MNQFDKTLKLLTGSLIVLAISLSVLIWSNAGQKNLVSEDSVGGLSPAAVNLIGTRVGTSTTGVAYTSTSTVNTYRKMISSDVDEATIDLITTAASAATVNFSLFASNDNGCDTATTTGDAERIADINWFDAGYLAKGLDYSTTIAAATTTFTWSPTAAGQGKRIVFENIAARCLRLDLAATSTTLYASLKTKKN